MGMRVELALPGPGMVQSMEHESGTFELLEIGMKSPQQEGEI